MVETKSFIDWIIEQVQSIIDINSFRDKVRDFITVEYNNGLQKSELKFDMNFIPNDKDITFLENYTFNNLKFHTDQFIAIFLESYNN